MDSAWEQDAKRLETRKMVAADWASELKANTSALRPTQCGASVAQPERVSAGQSPASSAPEKIARDHFIREKRGRKQKYTPKRQARKLYKAMESASCDSRSAP